MKVPTDILTQEELEKATERLDLIFSTWDDLCQNHTLTSEFKNSFFLSVPITTEATLRYILDVRRIKQFHPEEIENINEYKIAGYLTYWICKLKPVVAKEQIKRYTRTQNFLNEELAFHIAIARINQERTINNRKRINFDEQKSRSSQFLNDLFYTLKYRITTGDTLALIYRNLETF